MGFLQALCPTKAKNKVSGRSSVESSITSQ